jgi:3-hydroxybutyrate dehydrogenase
LGIARRLAQGGMNVMLNGLGDAEAAEEARAGIEADFGVRALYSPANMMDEDAIAAMMAQAADDFGSVDVLVNNAGIQHVAPIDEFPVPKWDAIIAINLTAAFHTIRAAVPGMRDRGWGRIINVASAHALVASPYKSAYVAAKHGLLGLTKTVALEVAPHGVTANAIAPGYVWTPLVEAQIPDTMAARGLSREEVIGDVLLAAQPTKQFVTVEQVAALAAFLASDEAASITGTVQAIDGGWTAH